MSSYGAVWENIRSTREKLAEALGVTPADLPQLSVAIRRSTDHAERVSRLLVLWAELETEAARFDPDTGEPR